MDLVLDCITYRWNSSGDLSGYIPTTSLVLRWTNFYGKRFFFKGIRLLLMLVAPFHVWFKSSTIRLKLVTGNLVTNLPIPWIFSICQFDNDMMILPEVFLTKEIFNWSFETSPHAPLELINKLYYIGCRLWFYYSFYTDFKKDMV